MTQKIVIIFFLVFVSITLFSEKVVMVFPHENDVIVLFDDNSWFYHSQISWYDMVDFVHYDEESKFAVLEENSYRVSDNKIMIQGVVMNTSEVEKRCEIAYTLIGENQELLSKQKLISRDFIKPGYFFHYEIAFDKFQGIPKYVKFDYIQDFEE